jgi:hypothetical protein
MRRYGLLFALTACAQAAQPGAPIDATVVADAPPILIDAPVTQPDGTMPSTCISTDTCASAIMLGTVSGDTGNMKLMMTGFKSAWFRVRVTEDDNDFPGLTLRVSSKLAFPANGFETYVYVNSGSDVPSECAITTGTRQTVGNVQTVKAEWGEGVVPNGGDDGRNVSIEVRPVGTSCAAGQEWQLEVEGNWL